MAKKRTAIKLDLGAGQNPTPGFLGVDLWEGADVPLDLLTFPWPWQDRSVDEIVSNHFVEHIPMNTTGPDLLCQFMNEVWRVLRPGGRATIQHPHLHSDRAFWDPTHRRFIPYMTWYYFDAEWRKANGLDHYPIVADFTVVTIEGCGIANDVATKHHEVQQQLQDRSWNVIADTKVILERR